MRGAPRRALIGSPCSLTWALAGRPCIGAQMENYYDPATGDWITDRSRYEKVLAEPRFAAIREDELRDWAPEQARVLILQLLAAVPEDTLQYVGLGPLEDFMRRNGAEFIDRIEGELRQNARLRAAALNMYLSRGDLPAAIEARLSAALGPEFWFLDDRAG